MPEPPVADPATVRRDRHPEIRVVGLDVNAVACTWEDLTAADMVRAIKDGAPIGTITKSEGTGATGDRLFVKRTFLGDVNLTYVADRDEVCERRVIGTERVQVPDPAAPLVTVERDVVEWVCAPILDGAA